MQGYIYWSIVVLVVTVMWAVLAVGIHRADLTSFGGDPLGSIILFYIIAFLAWLNALVATGIAWSQGSYENAMRLFFIQLLAVPFATVVLNTVAFSGGPIARDIVVSVYEYFSGSKGVTRLRHAITDREAEKTRRMLQGYTLYPINGAKKKKLIFEVASKEWPYLRLGTEITDAIADAGREYGEALLCGTVTVYHQIDTVNQLLGKGYDVNQVRCDGGKNHPGAPPLALVQYQNVFQILLKAGAELNATDAQGTQALSMLMLNISGQGLRRADGHFKMHALTERDLVNALKLSRTNFDPNLQNARGNTALIVASGTDLRTLARALLKRGADPNLKNKEGHTALYYAKSEGMKKLLTAHGARSS